MHLLSESLYDYLVEKFGKHLFLVEDSCGNFAVFFHEGVYENWRYRYCPNRYPRSLKRWARGYYGKPDFTVDDISVLRKLQAEFHVFD